MLINPTLERGGVALALEVLSLYFLVKQLLHANAKSVSRLAAASKADAAARCFYGWFDVFLQYEMQLWRVYGLHFVMQTVNLSYFFYKLKCGHTLVFGVSPQCCPRNY